MSTPAPTQQEPVPTVAATDPLVGYRQRMRRLRWIYVAALAALTIAIVVLVQVVLRTGEISHASLHTATSAPPSPVNTATSPTLTQAWHSDDATANGIPFDGGTVVTYSAHTVSGRNYATGAVVWSYTRTDVSICTVFQEVGTTVAVFTDADGYCDEVDTFETRTGTRDWFRTLDSNGNTVYGKPVITANQYTMLITTPNYVQAVDPSGGIDRWTFVQPAGCTTTTTASGSQGVLIGQHCGDGDYLVLRSPYDADNDQDKNKPVKWRIKSDALPVSAEQVVSAIDPKTGQLLVFGSDDGKAQQPQTLNPAPTASAARTVDAVTNPPTLLINVGGTTYALDQTFGNQLWSLPTSGLPVVQDGTLLAITNQGIVELDSETGRVLATHAIAAPTGPAHAVRLGTGFIVAGSSTTVYH